MRGFALLLFTLLMVAPLSARRSKDVANMHDVDLVYYGSRYRSIAWDADWARTHVAYTDSTGKTHYLFDTFLLLELHTGTGRFFEPAFRPTHPRNEIGTTKEDWMQIVDTLFQVPTRNIDRALDEVAREIGKPKYKRQVVMFVPVPTEGQTNWGELNGRALDFNSTEDRITACKWFVDMVRERFRDEKFRNLSLAGFYWLAEDKNSGLTMLPTITNYVRSLGMKTIWIPYYNAAGAADEGGAYAGQTRGGGCAGDDGGFFHGITSGHTLLQYNTKPTKVQYPRRFYKNMFVLLYFSNAKLCIFFAVNSTEKSKKKLFFSKTFFVFSKQSPTKTTSFLSER